VGRCSIGGAVKLSLRAVITQPWYWSARLTHSMPPFPPPPPPPAVRIQNISLYLPIYQSCLVSFLLLNPCLSFAHTYNLSRSIALFLSFSAFFLFATYFVYFYFSLSHPFPLFAILPFMYAIYTSYSFSLLCMKSSVPFLPCLRFV
jgi:hypothetical protein